MFCICIFKKKKKSVDEQEVSFLRGEHSHEGTVRPSPSTLFLVLWQIPWCLCCPVQVQGAHSVVLQHPHKAACLLTKHRQSNPKSFHPSVPHCPFSCIFDLVGWDRHWPSKARTTPPVVIIPSPLIDFFSYLCVSPPPPQIKQYTVILWVYTNLILHRGSWGRSWT